MTTILAGILSLAQYLKTLREEPNDCRLKQCCHCGRAEPWHHGHYHRKADRSPSPNASLNPIPILRFFCPECRHTSSVLPECIPPRRWYLWDLQQAIFLTILAGQSLYAAAQSVIPSYHTIHRWIRRFKDRFQCHKETLIQAVSSLGITQSFIDFWQAVLHLFSLGHAMRLCHVAGILIP